MMVGIQETSVVGRLRRFFLDNPDEELRIVDIQSKLDCSQDSARFAIATLRKMKMLESVHVVRMRSKGIAQ